MSKNALPAPHSDSDMACVATVLRLLSKQHRAIVCTDPTYDYKADGKSIRECGHNTAHGPRLYPMRPLIRRAKWVMRDYFRAGRGPKVASWRWGKQTSLVDDDSDDVLFDSDDEEDQDADKSNDDKSNDDKSNDETGITDQKKNGTGDTSTGATSVESIADNVTNAAAPCVAKQQPM